MNYLDKISQTTNLMGNLNAGKSVINWVITAQYFKINIFYLHLPTLMTTYQAVYFYLNSIL